MRLPQQQGVRRTENQHVGQHPVPERAHARKIQRNQVRENQHDGELCNFGRLELPQRPQIDPAVDAAGPRRRRHKPDQNQQGEREQQQRNGKLVQMVVIEIRNKNHHPHADYREQSLADDEIIAVSKMVIGVGIACRKHHHKADDQKDQNKEQKRQVHAGTDGKNAELFAHPFPSGRPGLRRGPPRGPAGRRTPGSAVRHVRSSFLYDAPSAIKPQPPRQSCRFLKVF